MPKNAKIGDFIVSVLLSALVERISVSRRRDFGTGGKTLIDFDIDTLHTIILYQVKIISPDIL